MPESDDYRVKYNYNIPYFINIVQFNVINFTLYSSMCNYLDLNSAIDNFNVIFDIFNFLLYRLHLVFLGLQRESTLIR